MVEKPGRGPGPEGFRMEESEAARLRSRLQERRRPPRHRRGETFLRGPIPLAWLEALTDLESARSSGKLLHTGLALWFRAGIENRRRFRVPTPQLRRFGVGRKSARRCLQVLADGGLIQVIERRFGRAPVIELCDPLGR